MAHTNLLFSPPFLTNFGFPKKTPSFSTPVQTPKSKRGEIRYSTQPYPIWTWDWPVNFMRGSEQAANSDYQYLVGFFINMGGMLSDFLYQDPYDNAVTDCFFGMGDGSTTQFQLTRTIGIGTDIVQNVNGTIVIKETGTTTTAFTLGTTGIITFSAAPAAGKVLTWSGAYYYRARFDTDALDFEQFMDALWSVGSLKMISLIL
jgi:uncharacterized protein (TIGR02217 family)